MRRPHPARAAALVFVLASPALGLVDPPCPPAASDAPVALVFSGDVEFARTRAAARLYAERRVGVIVFSGAGVGGDSASEMARLAVGLGVAPADVRVEPQATSTRENAVFAAPLLRAGGWPRVGVVTSRSHALRATRAVRRAFPGIEVVAMPVPDPGPRGRLYRQRVQEWAKLAWYAARGWI